MTYLLSLAVLALAVGTAAHALLYKRDTRAVTAWVALIVMVPLAGAIAYWLLAVNRVQRKAMKLRPQPAGRRSERAERAAAYDPPDPLLLPLARVGDQLTPFALTGGTSVEVYEDGDTAFPAMIDAINRAQRSISLATYIFNADEVGLEFRDALVAAAARGVEVRVLVDAVGGAHLGNSIVDLLQIAGVRACDFMPVARPLHALSFNLRNHRKLLIIDGAHAFTGSMNITVANRLADPGDVQPMRDIQFELRGPVVRQLQQVFVDDWAFAADEELTGAAWFPEIGQFGNSCLRVVPDGPDENFETVRLLIYGALAGATRSISIVTPYFLPDAALIAALNTAALRGVRVDIVMPEESDNRLVRWASQALYWQLLQRGCRIWLTPPPFDHSKFMSVDDAWTMIGSSNWDPRSLRLNFELNVEIYDAEVGARMRRWFDARVASAHEVTKADIDSRPLAQRLRDGVARLFTPYL
ncbi:MAG: cardiolipin synthase [Gammaproteobacteria bacterium]